jgi:two-component system, sensor histidine kinase and response regulator
MNIKINKLLEENIKLSVENKGLLEQYNALVQKNDTLEQQNIALTSSSNKEKIHRFLSIISHDVKAPLWSIKNIFDYTKDDESKQQIIEFLPEIHKSINNTVGLLENLLEWTKNSNIKERAHKNIINLKGSILKTLEIYELSIKSKQLVIEINCDESLQIEFHKEMFYTVLRNLLNNAVKYSPKNGNIVINCYKLGDKIKFNLSNTAYCVNDEQVAYLNCEATKSVKSLQNEVGSGLGLMIVKEFLELNNTTIQYTNENNTYINCTLNFEAHISNVLKAVKSENHSNISAN